MPIDDRTTNRSYKLPNASNHLADDVVRLRDALAAIDADVYARYTKLEVDQLITNLIAGAPGALDTLDELAAALGDDANFAATVTNQLALKANASAVYTKAESDARYVQGQTQAEMVFTATANQSVFTLSTAIINKPSALVTVDGVVQPTSEYSINMTGTQLTLSEGVPAGTVVRVLALGVSSEGAPADDTVTTAKLRDGAVTTAKIADAAITTDKIATGTIVTADLADGAVTTAKIGNGAVTPAKLAQPLTQGAAKTASGTAVDFSSADGTGVPSWARRVTVILNGVSRSQEYIQFRLGDSVVKASGYAVSASSVTTANAVTSVSHSGGFIVHTTMAGSIGVFLFSGSITFTNVSGNTWVGSGVFAGTGGAGTAVVAGTVTLDGPLAQVRIRDSNSGTLGSGTINILYE